MYEYRWEGVCDIAGIGNGIHHFSHGGLSSITRGGTWCVPAGDINLGLECNKGCRLIAVLRQLGCLLW